MLLSDRFLNMASQAIKWETGGDKAGGFTHDPDDPGGETKWGISKRAHPDLDIKSLTYKDAINIYHGEYWNKFYELILDEDLTFKIFDMGILNHPKVAVEYIQEVILSAGKTIKVDGNFGPLTLTAINLLISDDKGQALYAAYLAKFRSRVKWITRLKPWMRKYRKGWLNRIEYAYVKKASKSKASNGGV